MTNFYITFQNVEEEFSNLGGAFLTRLREIYGRSFRRLKVDYLLENFYDLHFTKQQFIDLYDSEEISDIIYIRYEGETFYFESESSYSNIEKIIEDVKRIYGIDINFDLIKRAIEFPLQHFSKFGKTQFTVDNKRFSVFWGLDSFAHICKIIILGDLRDAYKDLPYLNSVREDEDLIETYSKFTKKAHELMSNFSRYLEMIERPGKLTKSAV